MKMNMKDGHVNFDNYIKMLRLENTNLIYDGIKRLWEQIMYGKQRENVEDDIAEDIKKIYCNCRSKANFLSQNLMSVFFKFLGYQTQKKLDQKDSERIAGMVLLYDKVLEMENNHVQMGTDKTYSEDYDEICRYLSMIGNDRDCYLAHIRDSQNIILASSEKEYDENIVRCLQKIEKGGKNTLSQYADTVLYENDVFIIKLLVNKRKGIEYMQSVYILFSGKDEITEDEQMQIARGVLFLRQQLQHLLERDLYAMHHFRLSYEDVKPIVKEDDVMCRVLHITDLHVDEKNAELIKSLIQKTKFGQKKIVNNDKQKEFDLIVITGDVAQGKSTATDMEENYRKAAEVIRCLAKKIWPDEKRKGGVRQDWKKRVVIIPGNHDYASMNELVVIHRNRATFNGEPAREEGSPMIKYTYYIDFLRKLLDLDISDMIEKNLNDYRKYPNLNLEVVSLNTVAEVSMLRNNKMQIDMNYYEALPKDGGEDYTKIYLLHHTPLYKNDYNRDKYWEPSADESLFSMLRECVQYYIEAEKSRNWQVWDGIKDKLEDVSLEGKRTAIYGDIYYLYQHRNEFTNERCQQIVNDYQRNEKMSSGDLYEYQYRLGNCFECISPDIILGGHVHKERKGKYVAGQRAIDCYEGAKFFEKDGKGMRLHYGILEIRGNTNSAKRKLEYEYYVTNLENPLTKIETMLCYTKVVTKVANNI